MRADARRRHAWVTTEKRAGAWGSWSARCATCELLITVVGGFGLDRVIEAARDASSCPGPEAAPSSISNALLVGLLERGHD